MSVGLRVGLDDVVAVDEQVESVRVEPVWCSGWVRVVEYVATRSGIAQPIVKDVFVGYVGRVAPKFPVSK